MRRSFCYIICSVKLSYHCVFICYKGYIHSLRIHQLKIVFEIDKIVDCNKPCLAVGDDYFTFIETIESIFF